ncbi:hypothetical protein TNCV_5139651 [Trichonephila clavipes]|nr:hypothetical protein TNCV_5139651 [Trichonephila clavipes]
MSRATPPQALSPPYCNPSEEWNILVCWMCTMVLKESLAELRPQRTSLAGLAPDTATSSGLKRAFRSAMQDPIQAPPGATRQARLYTS